MFVLSIYLKISTLVLSLYDFKHFDAVDKVLLSFGIILALLWLGVSIGMVKYMFIFILIIKLKKENLIIVFL